MSKGRVLDTSLAQRKVQVEALFLLSAINPLLRLGPSALTGRLLRRAAASQDGVANRQIVSDVVRAIKSASSRVPGSTCLAQALAGWLMVSRRHQGAVVRLGVNRDEGRGLLAHAWLECNGENVIGEQAAGDYVPFPPLP